MLTLIYIFIIGSIFLILLSFFNRESYKLPAELRKKRARMHIPTQPRKASLYFTSPLLPFNRWFLNRFGQANLTNKLSAAEVNLSPEDYLGIKECLVIGLVTGLFLLKQAEPLWVLGAIALAFFLPEFYLRLRIQRRTRLILNSLPEVIDLLTLCVEGGLDLMLGLDWVVGRSSRNPLIDEFFRILQETKTGKSRQEALKDMAKRLSIPEISSFINTLVYAERMGTSMGEILNTLSEEARQQRFQRGERLALQAPIKMLFPLVIFILPVVGIIVGGPVILQFLQGGLPKF